jgi:hypothetical protein
MRDDSYFDEIEVVETVTRRPRWASAAGAVLSVVTLALLVTWAYRLGVRDAQSVPVIRAVEGPARIRPEDPGGARFDHQGRAVYDAVRAAGAAPDTPEDVALAPPPEPLTAEDRAPAEVAAAIAETAAAEEAAAAALIANAPETDVALRIEQLVAEAVGGDPVDVALIDPTPRAPVASPVAPPRPGSAAAALAPPATPAPAEVDPEPVRTAAAPAPVILSGPMIQLGAYLSEETALSMWSEIARRNGDLLAGRDPVLGGVRQGGQDLVLLRAGPFESGDQAIALCAQMRARNEDCLTVGAR